MRDNLPQKSQLLVYGAESGAIEIAVRSEKETAWLTRDFEIVSALLAQLPSGVEIGLASSDAPTGRFIDSPGQRPGLSAPTQIQALKGRPNLIFTGDAR
jgi:hypothetical protein